MLFLMRRYRASTFAMPRWPRLARTRSPSRGRRSPPLFICRASSARTGGPPMHGEAPPAWRLATSRWPALARARLSADLDVGQRRPVELLSTSAGPPCIIGPHRRPSDARRVWPRRPARAGPAVQCQPCRACETTAMTSSDRTGGPPMPQLLPARQRRGDLAWHLRAAQAALRYQARPPPGLTAGRPSTSATRGVHQLVAPQADVDRSPRRSGSARPPRSLGDCWAPICQWPLLDRLLGWVATRKAYPVFACLRTSHGCPLACRPEQVCRASVRWVGAVAFASETGVRVPAAPEAAPDRRALPGIVQSSD